ncbi:MAG: conjugation TrbI family protein [Bradyrhizobium sp.]|nr:conjugation TrbI family protein [Bradyrhizobium sp.]
MLRDALLAGLGIGLLPDFSVPKSQLAAPENRQSGDPVIVVGRESLQDSVNQAGQEMTRRNLNVQPTLTERPGLPIPIIVNRDLVLRPYQPLFFDRGTSRSSITRKLRLGPLPKTENIKMTFACATSLKAEFDRYGATCGGLR